LLSELATSNQCSGTKIAPVYFDVLRRLLRRGFFCRANQGAFPDQRRPFMLTIAGCQLSSSLELNQLMAD